MLRSKWLEVSDLTSRDGDSTVMDTPRYYYVHASGVIRHPALNMICLSPCWIVYYIYSVGCCAVQAVRDAGPCVANIVVTAELARLTWCMS